MIKHVVCFKLSEPSEELLKKTRDILLSMKGNVPMLRDIEVGVDFLHSSRSYDIILIVTLDSKEDLDKYQNDHYHCDVVKRHMHSVASSSIALDWVVGDK